MSLHLLLRTHLLSSLSLLIYSNAVAALLAGDVEKLGRLMTEAQLVFDAFAMPACPSQLTMPILHRVDLYCRIFFVNTLTLIYLFCFIRPGILLHCD